MRDIIWNFFELFEPKPAILPLEITAPPAKGHRYLILDAGWSADARLRSERWD